MRPPCYMCNSSFLFITCLLFSSAHCVPLSHFLCQHHFFFLDTTRLISWASAEHPSVSLQNVLCFFISSCILCFAEASRLGLDSSVFLSRKPVKHELDLLPLQFNSIRCWPALLHHTLMLTFDPVIMHPQVGDGASSSAFSRSTSAVLAPTSPTSPTSL